METSTACLVFATLLASACVCQSQPGLPKACKPSGECLAYGGYCISNSQKGDCNGLLFAKECQSALCSCCIEATLKRDECQEMPGVCPNGTSVCQDKDAGYECVCNAGFETTVCGDIDECVSNPCEREMLNSTCKNTNGSYECICPEGYIPSISNGSCMDINECNSATDTCLRNEQCTNTQGSYTCEMKCPANETYIPLQNKCAIRISGNMTFFEGQTLCTEWSTVMAEVKTNELINFYGDAFLPNVGDTAWVLVAGSFVLQTPVGPILTRTAANSTIAGELGYYSYLPYVLCYKDASM